MALLAPLGERSDAEIPHTKVMKTPTKPTIILIVASALAVLFVTACGTVRGFGRDVEKTGENIERSAR
jgi:predicted small secreted protein